MAAAAVAVLVIGSVAMGMSGRDAGDGVAATAGPAPSTAPAGNASAGPSSTTGSPPTTATSAASAASTVDPTTTASEGPVATTMTVELVCGELDVTGVPGLLGTPITATFEVAAGDTWPEEYELPFPAYANICDFWGEDVTVEERDGEAFTRETAIQRVRFSSRGIQPGAPFTDSGLAECESQDLDSFGDQGQMTVCDDGFLTLIDTVSVAVVGHFGGVEFACTADVVDMDAAAVRPPLEQLCRTQAALLAT